MPKSRHRRKSRSSLGRKRSAAPAKLELASDLIDEGRIAEANTLLVELERQYPSHRDVLNSLAFTCYELGDKKGYLRHCRKLLTLTGESNDALCLASAYLLNDRPVLALREYSRFLERWPKDQAAEKVRNTIASTEPALLELIADAGLFGEEGLKSAAMHEEVQVLLEDGLFEEACALAVELIERHPHFAPAYNNLSLTQFFGGHTEEAIATARRALEFAPDNFQAVANLARFLRLSGGRDEALALGERLRETQPGDPELWLKKAETFTFLYDDQAVMKVFNEAERAGMIEEFSGASVMYHLAAAATLHLGNESEARKYWKKALDLAPGLKLAEANLNDLNKPIGERHGPWAYDLRYWIPKQTFDEIVAVAKTDHKDRAATQLSARFLERHPEIAELIPLMLARAGPGAADFAIALVGTFRTPDMLEAVRDFALGMRGSDSLRLQAARLLVGTGLLPAAEEVRMWVKGEWTTMSHLSFEITEAPYESSLPSKAKKLLRTALDELIAQDGSRAEWALKEALKIAPDETLLLYNLALAYYVQGRNDEYRQLVRQLHERDPDYLFARVQMAKFYVESDEIEKANEMLQPLMSRKKLHVDEFAALCSAKITLLLREERRDAARSWFKMLEDVCPHHQNVEPLRMLVAEPYSRKSRGRPGWWRK